MKKLLLATLFLALATPTLAGGLDEEQAVAPAKKKKAAAVTQTADYNLIHPFYGPAKGAFVSETGVGYEHIKGNRGNDNFKVIDRYVFEEIGYGITDNFTVYGGIERDWGRFVGFDESWIGREHSKADTWYLVTSYNFINDGKNFLQGLVGYGQTKLDEGGVNKSYELQGTYGYNLGWLTPYVKLTYQNGLNNGKDNDDFWTGKVAAYKEITKNLGTDLGIAYTKDTSESEKTWDLVANVSYMLTKDVALTLGGTYALDASTTRYTEPHAHYSDYSVGASIKVAF